MLRSKPGIVYAELMQGRDGDAYTFNIESEVGVDIRKSLFYSLAEKGWPLVGMEALGMSLEEVFVAIVDQMSQQDKRYERPAGKRSAPSRNRAEQDFARTITEKKKKSEDGGYSALFGDDE